MKEHRLLHGSAWIVSGQFVSMAFQAAYFVLMGRTFGSREYGAFVGVVALVALLTQFSSAGMEMILLRNISRDRKSFAPTWGNALFVSACGFVLVLAAAWLIGSLTLRPQFRVIHSLDRHWRCPLRKGRPARQPRLPGGGRNVLLRPAHCVCVRRPRSSRRSPLSLRPLLGRSSRRLHMGTHLLACALRGVHLGLLAYHVAAWLAALLTPSSPRP